jgi:putative DNA primase/helicase
MLAINDRFNSLREYLDPLCWDECPRVERWLQTYANAEDTPYARAVGRALLVAAIARAYQPGIKYDTMVVLEGPQGVGKSTLLMILGTPNGAPSFTAEGLPHSSEKDIVDAMRGRWIIEMCELDHMERREVNELKAFLSRTTDRVRLAYRSDTQNFPRQCVLVGTTNESEYLRDATGNRRFLPVIIGQVDFAALDRDRDQLWAEAKSEWLVNQEPRALEIPGVLWGAASEEQEQRRIRDSWEDVMEEYVQGQLILGERDRFFGHELLFEVGHLAPERATLRDTKRLGQIAQRVLGARGFIKRKCRDSNGRSVWGWVKQ